MYNIKSEKNPNHNVNPNLVNFSFFYIAVSFKLNLLF
jgi:hypothetical protein